MKALLCLITTLMLLSCQSDTAEQQTQSSETTDDPVSIQQALAIAASKYAQSAQASSPTDGYPRVVENGAWQSIAEQDWTDGFFPGILWQLSELDSDFEALAQHWTLPLSDRLTFQSHDLGFIFDSSFGHAFRYTADDSYLQTFIEAANMLQLRYSPEVGATRSWDFGNYQYPVIIDNIMNIKLLFEACLATNNITLCDSATTHAQTTRQHHQRADGSTYHLVDFSPTTGEVLNKVTVQGLSNESTWSRGQAWAIYGFAQAYEYTGITEFQQSAEAAADFFLANLPEDNIPYWDFSANGSNDPKDTSAAAVAAAGLLKLADTYTQDSDQQQQYQAASKNIINTLLLPQYFSADLSFPALLTQATGNYPSNREVNTSLIYADYYFLEALISIQDN